MLEDASLRQSGDEGSEPDAHAFSAARDASSDDELPELVGRNLKKLRKQHRYSLDRLAQRSGVSRAMLGQIELGRSVPTIRVLWRIASAFKVPVSAFLDNGEADTAVLLPDHDARILESHDGRVTSRALFPFEGSRNAEFYKMTFSAGVTEHSEPHPPGTTENLVVAEGRLRIGVGADDYVLESSDAIQFVADLAHSYHNPGEQTAIAYVVISYPDPAEYR